MTWGFERGRVFNRTRDIHERFGGQRQGGIITPSAFPLVIAITGEAGGQHGYSDRLREDGVFEYFGEGQRGDMQLVRGNRAIALHSVEGKSLLLFRKIARNGSLRFEGEWVCETVTERMSGDGAGEMRKAIVFELRSLDAIAEAEPAAAPPAQSLADLRNAAVEAATIGQTAGSTTRTAYMRSAAVRSYVLARAGGHCEGCSQTAPFLRPDGTPYLEPHHLRRVSDGGPDDIRFVIALCPNCHRRVHFAADGAAYNSELMARMKSIESD